MARRQATATSWALNGSSDCQRPARLVSHANDSVTSFDSASALVPRVRGNRKSTRWDSNPRCRITSAESSPLDDQCLLSAGPLGLEPRPARLRAGDAAANTSILFKLSVNRHRADSDFLFPELRPEGFEPPPCRLKACCAAVTPRPRMGGVCVSIGGKSSCHHAHQFSLPLNMPERRPFALPHAAARK